MESMNSLSSYQSQDVKTYPFICGICSLKFDHLGLFLRHFRTHGRTLLPKSNIHVCSCLIQDTDNVEEREDNEPYKCRNCLKKFFSICKVHNHVVNCSTSNGSYILDNSKKIVYPLSLHCSDFENRENDMSVDHVELDEENENHKEINENQRDRRAFISQSENNMQQSETDFQMDVVSNGNSACGEMSFAQQVDHILKCVCKLFEKGEAEEISNVESMDNIREKKKISPKKQLTSDKTRTEKAKRKRVKSCTKTKVNEEEESNVNHQVFIKIELKEDNHCAKISGRNNFGKSDGVTAEVGKSINNVGINENVDINNDVVHDDDDGDDDDDLTDEYSPEDVENTLKKDNTCRNRDTKDSLKHTKIKSEVNHKKVKERIKTLRKDTENIIPKKRGYNQKAAEECPHCGKILKPYKMKIHLVSHMEERPFQCDLCPKSYKYQGHLESHKASHQEVKPFYCEICGKGYVTHTMLKHHSMMHHSDSKPCVCNICGASFITNYKLKRHMTKHTGEKTVQCDLCGMGFSTRYNLNIHIQGVHKRDHRFTCAQCGKNFMTNYQLKVHTMKHSGERPYKCSVCKAEYIERKELRRHLKKNHNLPLEENTSTITEVIEGYGASKIIPTKDIPQLSQFSGLSHDQVMEQTETSSAADYITAGNESLYSYATTNMCPPAPYNSAIKKLLPPNEYQMIYGNSQEYNYDNSTTGLTLPLTVQEIHEPAKYLPNIQEACAVKDLSKNGEEKIIFDGNAQHDAHLSKQLINRSKDGAVASHDKLNQNFASL